MPSPCPDAAATAAQRAAKQPARLREHRHAGKRLGQLHGKRPIGFVLDLNRHLLRIAGISTTSTSPALHRCEKFDFIGRSERIVGAA